MGFGLLGLKGARLGAYGFWLFHTGFPRRADRVRGRGLEAFMLWGSEVGPDRVEGISVYGFGV